MHVVRLVRPAMRFSVERLGTAASTASTSYIRQRASTSGGYTSTSTSLLPISSLPFSFVTRRSASSMEVLGRRPRRKDPFRAIKKPRNPNSAAPPTAIEALAAQLARGPYLGASLDHVRPDDTPRHSPELLLMSDAEVDDYLAAVETQLQADHRAAREELTPPDSVVLGKDPLAANQRFTFVFVDKSAGVDAAADMERDILLREPCGTLRTATPSERDRYNQQFFPKTYKVFQAPALFSDEALLREACARGVHLLLLGRVCKLQQPHQSPYKLTHRVVFDDIDARGAYGVLQKTPHWEGFVAHLVAEGRPDGLMKALLEAKRPGAASALAILASGDDTISAAATSDPSLSQNDDPELRIAALRQYVKSRQSENPELSRALDQALAKR